MRAGPRSECTYRLARQQATARVRDGARNHNRNALACLLEVIQCRVDCSFCVQHIKDSFDKQNITAPLTSPSMSGCSRLDRRMKRF